MTVPEVVPAAARLGGSPVLELTGVSKVFLTDEVETHALENVHLAINSGEWISIVGPSGSGKTTLLAILGLLDTPTAGHYRLDGRDASALDARERAIVRNRHIGFVFQSFNLIGALSVAENVELPLTYRGMSPVDRKARVEAALAEVGMEHRLRHLPSQLSGGQQQRVAVARAIAGDPAIVLADEPTGNLDSKNGEQVLGLLGRLHAAGSTICMVTHDLAIARNANRTIRLLDGQVVDDSAALDTAAR